MKAAFFYSETMWGYQWSQPKTFFLTIDGRQYTECVTLEDDAPVEPCSNYTDNRLVALFENVPGDPKWGIDYDSETFLGRIKIKEYDKT